MTETDFGQSTLPYGVFAPPGGPPRVGVACGTLIVDLDRFLGPDHVFRQSSLNTFMARGPAAWAQVRQRVMHLVADGIDEDQPGIYRQAAVDVMLPIDVADFVDFFSGIEHAMNAGSILRPGEEPLKPNYRHLPVGYHGRAGSVVPSGTPIVRPAGQFQLDKNLIDGPTRRLDIETELGYVVGVPSRLGEPVPAADFAPHVFGCVLLIDWSARDIQAWEYQPLGPFLGKSFATTISSWVVPLAALGSSWVPGPAQAPIPLPYLQVDEPRNLDIEFEFELNGQPLTRPRADTLYWSPAQQLAHMTRNGAPLRTGDLFGTGTISSFDASRQGSLLELSWGGSRPFELADGTARTYLQDGDTVAVRGFIRGDRTQPMGVATGTIVSSVSGLTAPAPC